MIIMEKDNLVQIGVIAKEANVNIQTLRYYEKRNIIKPESRTLAGYRLYSPDIVKTVRFIKHAQELGFPLKEIQELLELRSSNNKSRCQRARKRAQERLTDVQEKLKFLKQTEKILKKIIKNCEQNKESSSCPIIESME